MVNARLSLETDVSRRSRLLLVVLDAEASTSLPVEGARGICSRRPLLLLLDTDASVAAAEGLLVREGTEIALLLFSALGMLLCRSWCGS